MTCFSKARQVTRSTAFSRSGTKLSEGCCCLANAKCIEDLFVFRSLNYEVLVGDKKGISSVRCGKQYRLEFIVKDNTDDISIKVCRLLDISNHYK